MRFNKHYFISSFLLVSASPADVREIHLRVFHVRDLFVKPFG